MAEITPERRNIFYEETQFQAAVTEAVAQKLGASINFINEKQYIDKDFFVNGPYTSSIFGSLPFNGIDGFSFFKYNATIIDVWMFVQDQTGLASGTLTLDIQIATTSGGSFTTIFTTKPAIAWNAGNNTFIHVGSAISNTTAPVLSVTDIDAGTAVRMCITSTPTGSLSGACGMGIVIQWRPR